MAIVGGLVNSGLRQVGVVVVGSLADKGEGQDVAVGGFADKGVCGGT